MTERITSQYQPIFAVQILHHYWLDEGDKLFDSLSLESQEQHLLAYDVRKFLSVTPTLSTQKRLNSLGCLFKTTTLGFVVMMAKNPPETNNAALFKNLLFEFVLTVSDAQFFTYTALTLQPQTIVELSDKTEHKIYRYKTNVPVLSNATGVVKNQLLYLSQAIPALTDKNPKDRIEALFQDNNTLVQLISDDPNVANQSLYKGTNDFPVFVHQNDIPILDLPDDLIKPDDLENLPKRGILLSNDIPDTVFALLQLSPLTQGNGDFDFIDAHGQAKTTTPVFHIRFKNRSTQWHYYDKKAGKTGNPSFNPNPLPLTFFGNANPDNKKRKPSEGFVKAEFTNNDPSKVAGLISDIFE